MAPIIVGVAGGTGSGKTTVTEALMDELGDAAVLVQHDWYYRDQRDVPMEQRSQVNYDHPDAQESALLIEHLTALRRGECVAVPQYDFTTHTRAEQTRSIAPSPFIVVEGINTLASEALRACCDLTIFVDTPADIRFARRLARDIAERGRSIESITTQYFSQVRPMHEEYVAPCKARADLVLSGEAEVKDSVAKIQAVLAARVNHPRVGPRLLLLSNSTMAGEAYLGWAQHPIAPYLAGEAEALFIPYAAVDMGYDTYTAMVAEVLSSKGTKITGIHQVEDPVAAIEAARVIIVGGGNTFSLLAACQHGGLLSPIRRAIGGGASYIGWSAGANLACPTIKTTNDMPIQVTDGLDGLGLLPFQLNPHFTTQTLSGHGGETREKRLLEFVLRNPDVTVLGLPEGMFVAVEGADISLGGTGEAVCFRNGEAPRTIAPGPVALQ